MQRESDSAVEPDPVRDLCDPGGGKSFFRGAETVVKGENVVVPKHIGQRGGCIPGSTVREYGQEIVDGIRGQHEIFSAHKGFVEELRGKIVHTLQKRGVQGDGLRISSRGREALRVGLSVCGRLVRILCFRGGIVCVRRVRWHRRAAGQGERDEHRGKDPAE